MKKLVVLAVLLAAAALVLSTCSNPVDLLAELEVEVMKANDRYLEIENLDAARMGSSTHVSPSADVVVVFDRPVDGATLSGITLLENGTAVSVKTELNGSTLRVAKDPYFDNEKDYALTLTGVQGTDAAALLEPVSWSFHTGTAPAANISVYSKSALSEDGYSDDALITVFIEANLLADKFIVSQTPLSEPYSGLIGWASLVSGQTEYDYTLTGGDGAKTLYVLLVDEGSEPDVYSVVTQRAIYLDTVAPSSASISVSYSGNDPTYVKGTQVVSSASADAVGIGKVEFRIGGTLVATDTEAPYTHNWVTTSGYANGSSYTVVARAYDRAGNYLDSTTVNRTVDNILPTITAFSVDYAGFDASYLSATRTISATATDSAMDRVEFYIGGVYKASDYTSGYTYSWNTTTYSNGTTYAISCRAYDKAGNVSYSSSLNRVVDNIIVVPSVADLAAADDSGYYNSDNVTKYTSGLTFTGTAEAYSRVELLEGGSTVRATVYADSVGAYSADISLSDQSGHAITVRSTDRAGNVATQTNYVSVLVDTTEPLPPSVSTTDIITLDKTPTWTWTSGGGGGMQSYRYQLDSTTGSWSTPSSSVTYTASTLSDGIHTLYVQQKDAAYNYYSAPGSRSVRVTPVIPYSGQTGVSRTPTLYWRPYITLTGSYLVQIKNSSGVWQTIANTAQSEHYTFSAAIPSYTTVTWRILVDMKVDDYIPSSAGVTFTTGK